jgi:hypothetical protein
VKNVVLVHGRSQAQGVASIIEKASMGAVAVATK